MNNFEELLANYGNALATGASDEETLAHLDALLEWHKQVKLTANELLALAKRLLGDKYHE